ncbi:TPA: DUF1642 domain-containing protein [Streptococcus pneumoniae]|jgi:gp178|nr:DUF1642 domain-containing protein [Streptococcus pneumoniae]
MDKDLIETPRFNFFIGDEVFLKGKIVGFDVDENKCVENVVRLEYGQTLNVPNSTVYITDDIIDKYKIKVKIPQFVADWLEQSDWREETLGEQSVFDVLDNLKNDSKNGYYENVKRWIDGNGDLFARAWLYGYEVEKEKQYLVKMKELQKSYNYLNYVKDKNMWVFSTKKNMDFSKSHHTCKELEEAGFGWVFDCEGIEIEEVK